MRLNTARPKRPIDPEELRNFHLKIDEESNDESDNEK